ncbi:longitudinals lacking protein, isoforms H/M/V-like isoform X2 [Homarus americanus]|uniref:longitudinals lacking protein, isoforms H/M/V-like isoform X2 n=1 Tax=Homarus americanus TaxID=6706 RepID=UPI001C489186|nr:longitudinals lacking protein, isoforms H/M/V-like isoform X2 [Homarus americanus]
MAGDGLLSLRWNNHRTSFLQVLSSLKDKQTYSDVTLACGGKFYSVHKFVLSTCSEYFVDIMEKTPCKHPIIVLKDIRHQDLEALLNYMYLGEVNVLQTELGGLIKAAECLRIKGLAVPDESPPPPPPPGGTPQTPVKNWDEGSPQTQTKRRRYEDDSTSSNSSPPRKKSNSRPQSEGPVEGAATEDQTETSENNTKENTAPEPSVQQAQEQQPNTTTELTREESPHVSSENSQQEKTVVDNPVIKEENMKYEDDDVMHLPDTCSALEVQMVESDGSSQGTPGIKYEVNLPGNAGGSSLLPSVSQQYSTHPQSFEEIVSQALPGPSGMQADAGQSWDGSRREGDMATSFHLQGFSQQEGLNPHHRGLQQVVRAGHTSDLMSEDVELPVMAADEALEVIMVEPGNPSSHLPQLGSHGGPLPPTHQYSHHLEELLPHTSPGRPVGGTDQTPQHRCCYCKKEFPFASRLKRHLLVHTGEKPFSCPICAFSSAQRHNLERHVRLHHTSRASTTAVPPPTHTTSAPPSYSTTALPPPHSTTAAPPH